MECKSYVSSSRYVLFVFVLSFTCIASALIRRDDICGSYSGKRLYLELGERGVLTARNVTSSSTPRSQYAQRMNGSHEQCSLELITCPSCVIAITFRHLDLSHRCGGENAAMDSPCRCDYVWLSEPPNEGKSGAPFCGILNTPQVTTPTVPMAYRSQTRTLSIVLLFSENHRHAFTLEYSAERNRQFLKGSQSTAYPLGHSNDSQGGIITSPFFPALYPRDLGVEYVVNCNLEAATGCRVRVIFRDFQLATLSIMEFYDWNGNRLEVSSGGMFRPPVILSTGPSLMIRFYANGGTGLGYKAIYSFIANSLKDETVKPITDCGGYVDNFGGAITMMNMVDRGIKTYDCVWLIRPPKNFLHLKTHLFLKVDTFLDMADSTDLQVLQGLTSDQPILETIRHPITQFHPSRAKEHVIPSDVGFYVSLRGAFGPRSRLAIVYASFSYADCYARSDFLCKNHRCIPSQLNCDGFDHCGDNSDEPASCLQDWELQPQDKRWYAHTPNYYFPKMERYPDLKTATMVFIATSLGLVFLISALIVLLYHMGARARQQRELQNRLQTISDLLDGAHINGNMTPDEPPNYEAPPDYDDIIKVFSEPSNLRRKRKRNQGGSNRRSRSSPAGVHSALAKTQTTSVPALTNPLLDSPTIISRSCQTTPMPDTPPPPYMLSHTPDTTIHNRVAYNRSERGARIRESWLLFRDETSSEDNFTEARQLGNITCLPSTSVCDTSTNVPLDENQNVQHSDSAEETRENCRLLNTSVDKEPTLLPPDNGNISDSPVETNLNVTSRFDSQALQVEEFQQMGLTFDSLISREEGLTRDRNVPKISEQLCNCAGACGCASLALDNQQHTRLSRSLSEGMTLIDQGENLRALDIYFSQHDIGSEHRSHF